MKKLRVHLTYANVVSSLCLFLLLGGGAAFAATKLAKNSVGAKQIKANAVTTAKVKKAAITGAKLADGSVNGAKVQAGSLTAAQIDQSTLNSVRASNVYALTFGLGTDFCKASGTVPTGFTSKAGSTGYCEVTAPFSMANCVITATPGVRGLAEDFISIEGDRSVQTIQYAASPNSATFELTFRENHTDLPFSMIAVC